MYSTRRSTRGVLALIAPHYTGRLTIIVKALYGLVQPLFRRGKSSHFKNCNFSTKLYHESPLSSGVLISLH